MRASMGRVALVGFLSLGFAGCQMAMPSWSSLAWWKKKPDNIAQTDAPKYDPAKGATTASTASPGMPSGGQNPLNSLTAVSPSAYPAGGATAAGAVPASYQSSTYPTTPYGPAKLVAGAGATNTNPWSGGAAGASSPTAYGAANPRTNLAAASTPAYGANSTLPGVTAPTGVQPQTGLYNSSYAGGAANPYAAGAAMPGAMPASAPATMNPIASVPSASGYSSQAPDMSNYRTADARNSAAAGISAAPAGNMYNTPGNASVGAGSTNPSMAAATAMVGDRYASTMMADPNAAASAGPMPPEYRSSSTPLGAGTGYQPAAGVTIPGNTGYNPPDAYSTPAGTGSAGAAAPPQEYRPGGTSNYVPTGSSVQPTGGNGTDSSATMGGIRPASYQGSAGGVKTAGFTTSAGIPATTSASSEVYGAYQGGSASDPSNGSASATNSSSTTPALLPKQTW